METIWIKNASVHINLFRHGGKDVCIHDLSEIELEKVAEMTDKKIEEYKDTRWVSLPTARDKSKVTFYEGDEK